jgi:diaminopimelate epimerase
VGWNIPTTRPVRLVKAHAYGNDFLLVAREALPAQADLATFARRACDRHRGPGADGLMVIEADSAGAGMRLLNADGSPSEVSGNGVRCVAAWLAVQRNLPRGAIVTVRTDAGPKVATLLDRDGARLTFDTDMGKPTDPRQVDLDVGGSSVTAIVFRVGNPQCVVLGPATAERLQAVAAPLAVHPFFPEGTNVELAEVSSADEVRILIWERGVGPTAAAVASAAFGGANRAVDVVSPGGRQRVTWTPDGLRLTGWAEVIAEIDWWVA